MYKKGKAKAIGVSNYCISCFECKWSLPCVYVRCGARARVCVRGGGGFLFHDMCLPSVLRVLCTLGLLGQPGIDVVPAVNQASQALSVVDVGFATMQ
jgi:hypothetical protein